MFKGLLLSTLLLSSNVQALDPPKRTLVTNVTTMEEFNEVRNIKGYVLVMFYADWCHFCRSMYRPFEELAGEYQGKLKVVKIDVVSLGIKLEGVPIIGLLKDGQVIEKFNGAVPKKVLDDLLKKYIK